VARGPVSTATFGCARQALTARFRVLRGLASPPCAETTAASSQSSRTAANAAVTEETAGITRLTSSPPARSRRTTPKKPGSPEATTTAWPSCLPSASSAGSSAPIWIVRAPSGIDTAARCRAPPTTSVAVLSDAHASAPSSAPE
jgi:hypothetical protein